MKSWLSKLATIYSSLSHSWSFPSLGLTKIRSVKAVLSLSDEAMNSNDATRKDYIRKSISNWSELPWKAFHNQGFAYLSLTFSS